MLLPRFEYHEPASLKAAIKLLEQQPRSALIAGGTDLMVNMKKGLVKPPSVVSLAKIPRLDRIEFSARKGLSIGCLVTAAEVARDEKVWQHYPMLAEAASVLGSPLIRNLATVAGNVATARPAADFPPALICLGAVAGLTGPEGARQVELDKFFSGPGKTRAKRGEILTHLLVGPPPPKSGGKYLKLGARQALEISMVNVGAWLHLDKTGEIVTEVRICLGAVAPKPIRAKAAERVMRKKVLSTALIEEAATAASEECQPIDDFRGSAAYRRDMVKVLTRRCLTGAADRALGEYGG
jgi:carbon-monoxide dehydrogenase medium subunit